MRFATRSGVAAIAGIAMALTASSGFADASSHALAASGKKPLTKVAVTIPAASIAFLPLYVGVYDGIYKRAGLDVSLVVMPVTLEPGALLDGQVQFDGSLGYIDNAIARNATEFPMKVVEVSEDRAPFLLVGGTGIKKISQLKGQVIAADAANSEPDLFIENALALHGIKPGQYSVDEVGAQAAGRWDLVQAGKAAAAAVDPNDPVLPPVKGHTVLATGATYKLVGGGLATTDALIQNQPNLVKRMVVASAEASRIAATDETKAVAAMKKGLATLNFGYTEAQWKQAWKLSNYLWTKDGLPTAAAEKNTLTTAQASDSLSSTPAANVLFDLRYVPKQTK